MKSNYKNLLNCGILGASLLLGATACSDDHFDIKGQPGVNGGYATIWQCIQADSTLSDVAEVLKVARVMKDDKDSKDSLTYAQWLDRPMSVTAWLPKNGTFDADTLLKQIADAQAMQKDTTQSQNAGLFAEYQVVNQFVKNHIALFNYGSTATEQNVRLLNSKNCNFDMPKNLFNGVTIDASRTVHAGNGTLYVLEGKSPFSYNIFDYMSSKEEFSKVYDIIFKKEKNTFWPEGSTQGAMNESGQIVYVDSVYLNSNELLNYANALIKSEDSVYIAMIPSNEAWDGTYSVVEPLFQYGDAYAFEWDKNAGEFRQTGSKAYKFDTDSLMKLNVNSTIIESMFFNPTSFEGVDNHDSTEVINYVLHADSLIATNGVVYYNENKGGINPLFEGLTPIKASNGYIFAPKENRIKPEYSYIRKAEYRPGNILVFNDYQTSVQTMNLTKEDRVVDTLKAVNKKDTVYLAPIPLSQEVEDDWYNYFEKTGSNALNVMFRLNNLASGHYKISAQMLPNRIHRNTIARDKDGVTPVVENPQFTAQIFFDDDAKHAVAENKDIKFAQDSIRNVVLFEDFEVTKSYMKLPGGYETFPYLKLSISAAQQRKGKFKGLSIAKIIVEPIRK